MQYIGSSYRLISTQGTSTIVLYDRRPNTKVIMMMRNLKDVIVSTYYHHIQKKSQPYDQKNEFYKTFKELLHGRYGMLAELYALHKH